MSEYLVALTGGGGFLTVEAESWVAKADGSLSFKVGDDCVLYIAPGRWIYVRETGREEESDE